MSEVRRAAVNCLHLLSGVRESVFYPILRSLVHKAEEIIADQTYIIQVSLENSLVTPALNLRNFHLPLTVLGEIDFLLHSLGGRFEEESQSEAGRPLLPFLFPKEAVGAGI